MDKKALSDYIGSGREWFPPDGGSYVSKKQTAQLDFGPIPNVELAIILDMIAEDLAAEIERLGEENAGVECSGLWYVQEQVETYGAWARGDFG